MWGKLWQSNKTFGSFISGLLVALLLLPGILGALPQPELSAVDALLRDINIVVCTGTNSAEDQTGQHQQHDQECPNCIVCAAHHGVFASESVNLQTRVSAPRYEAVFQLIWRVPAFHPHDRHFAQQRGPPNFFLI
jgi:Protein of unknown function (DUF2946)